jgi:hypothetical protein
MKKLLIITLAMFASYGYAQEMRLPDDKKKKYVKEEPKKTEKPVDAQTVPPQSRERVAEGREESKEQSSIVNYCIVREMIMEDGSSIIDVETETSTLEKNRDADPAAVKKLMSATRDVKYKTALQAINALALHGYRVSSTNAYQSPKYLAKEYIMISGK